MSKEVNSEPNPINVDYWCNSSNNKPSNSELKINESDRKSRILISYFKDINSSSLSKTNEAIYAVKNLNEAGGIFKSFRFKKVTIKIGNETQTIWINRSSLSKRILKSFPETQNIWSRYFWDQNTVTQILEPLQQKPQQSDSKHSVNPTKNTENGSNELHSDQKLEANSNISPSSPEQTQKNIDVPKSGTSINYEDLDKVFSPDFLKSEELQNLTQDTNKPYTIDIKGFPGKDGKEITVKCEVVRESLYTGNDLQTQVPDPRYKKQLEKTKEQPHYTFKFYDPQTVEQIEEAKQTIKNTDPNEDDGFGMILAQSVLDEVSMPNALVRVSQDGSIGELKALKVASEDLSGRYLMKLVDKTAESLKVKQLYLEDYARIEVGEGVGYNLRLYRLFTQENQASWYGDSFHFSSYREENNSLINSGNNIERSSIDKLKECKIKTIIENLDNIKEKDKSIELILEYLKKENKEESLGNLLSITGKKINTKKPSKEDIENIKKFNSLTYDLIDILSKKDIDFLSKSQLETNPSSIIMNTRFMRKSYS